MFGVSFTEIVVIALVALLLFGPDELPRIARTVGKFMGEFRRHSDSLKREFYNSVYPPAQELRREIENETRSLRAIKHDILAGPDLSQPTSGDGPPISPAAPFSVLPPRADERPSGDPNAHPPLSHPAPDDDDKKA